MIYVAKYFDLFSFLPISHHVQRPERWRLAPFVYYCLSLTRTVISFSRCLFSGAGLSLNRQLMIHIILFGAESFAFCFSISVKIWLDEGKEQDEKFHHFWVFTSIFLITLNHMFTYKNLVGTSHSTCHAFPSVNCRIDYQQNSQKEKKEKCLEKRFEKLIREFFSISRCKLSAYVSDKKNDGNEGWEAKNSTKCRKTILNWFKLMIWCFVSSW